MLFLGEREGPIRQRLDRITEWMTFSERKRQESEERRQASETAWRESEEQRREREADIVSRLQETSQRLDEMSQTLIELQDASHVLSELPTASRTLTELRDAANKHDLAIADMLDTIEEWQQSRTEEADALREALQGEARREAAEGRRRESALVSLVIACHDQLFALERAAATAGDQAWTRQLELAEEKLSAGRLLAALEVIGGKGQAVNYDLHEVIAAVETEDPEKASQIADVYTCGYAYRGQILRKASVAAYQVVQRAEPAEETAEDAAEEVVEEPVEEPVEDAVEEAAADIAEEAVEDAAVEKAAEDAVEKAVEDAAEEVVENPVEKTVEDATENTMDSTAHQTENASPAVPEEANPEAGKGRTSSGRGGLFRFWRR